MALYRPRTRPSDINEMITGETVNNLVTDQRIDQRVNASRVDSLLTDGRIDQRVNSGRVDSLLTDGRIDRRVNAERVNGLVDLSGVFSEKRVELYFDRLSGFKRQNLVSSDYNRVIRTGDLNYGLFRIRVDVGGGYSDEYVFIYEGMNEYGSQYNAGVCRVIDLKDKYSVYGGYITSIRLLYKVVRWGANFENRSIEFSIVFGGSDGVNDPLNSYPFFIENVWRIG